jgi:hypothetical protein
MAVFLACPSSLAFDPGAGWAARPGDLELGPESASCVGVATGVAGSPAMGETAGGLAVGSGVA